MIHRVTYIDLDKRWVYLNNDMSVIYSDTHEVIQQFFKEIIESNK